MTKYIIKNCNSFCKVDAFNRTEFIGCCHNVISQCKDIENCLLKQIVEKCKKKLEFLSYGIPEQYLETMVTNAERYAKAELAQEILKLLEIEEVNE